MFEMRFYVVFERRLRRRRRGPLPRYTSSGNSCTDTPSVPPHMRVGRTHKSTGADLGAWPPNGGADGGGD